MRIRGPCTLKATQKDGSNSIILTVNAKEFELIRDKKLQCLFRKQSPTRFVPNRIYCYFSSPISAIKAKLVLSKTEILPVAEACKLVGDHGISKPELRAYAADWPDLVVYHIKASQVSDEGISCKLLSKEYNFWPSSTFIPLSEDGASELDSLGKFI